MPGLVRGPRLGVLLALPFAALVGCDAPGTLDPTVPASRGVVAGSGADATLACTPAIEVDLVAGQTLDVGVVSVANDNDRVYVTFAARDGWSLAHTALYVGADLLGVPTTRAGQPQVGRFPDRMAHAGGVVEYTYAMSLPSSGGELVVAAFAEVVRGDREEGAWAAGEPIGGGGGWGTWFAYTTGPCPGETIGPEGGRVSFESLELVVPPGALLEDVPITVRRVDPPASPLAGDVVLLNGTAYDLGPDGLEFLVPFEIRIGYDPANLPAGVAEGDLKLFQLNADIHPLPTTVNEGANVLTAWGEHFSTFAGGASPWPFQIVECPAFTLQATTGLPLDEIAIGALPASFELPVAAAIAGDGGEPAGLAYIVPDETGSLHMIVPLHPTAGVEGGPVRMAVTDGILACPPFDFTVQPLPPADGELGAIVDLLQDILTEQAAELQTTREELVATAIEELPPPVWPLALTQAVLDDPSNPGSLRALAQGAAGDEALDWLDRILARTDVRSSLESPAAAAAAELATPLQPAAVSAIECLPDVVNTAQLLNDCMSAAAAAQRSANGISRKVADDIVKAFGVASDLELPAADVVGAAFGSAFWVIYTERNKAAALLPSHFTAMNIEVDKDRFEEDEEGTGSVTFAEVFATNDGYNLQEELFNAIDQAASLASTTGKFDFSTGTPADDLAAKLIPVIEQRLRGMQIDELDIAAELFGPVDVKDAPWIQARVAAGDAIAVVGEPATYEPRSWGVATLSVRTADGFFGGQQIAEQVDVTVRRIQLTVTPSDVRLKAGEPQGFSVTVSNSTHPESVDLVEPSSPWQGTVLGIEYIGEGLHIVSYVAPANPDPTRVDLMTVGHTAETGARRFSNESRTATATIRFPRITISPRELCLQVGGAPAPFNVKVEGLADETVVWSASIGLIDEQTGEYTPTTAGTAIITATSAVDPDVSDQVAIQVGGCVCSWSGTADGVPFAGQDGDFGEVLRSGGGTAIETVIVGRDDAGAEIVAGFTTFGDPPLPLGATGTFPIFVTGKLGAESTLLGYTTDERNSVQAAITENSEDVLAGTLTGSVFFFEPFPDGKSGTFSLTFRITRDPLDSTETVSHCTIGGVGGA